MLSTSDSRASTLCAAGVRAYVRRAVDRRVAPHGPVAGAIATGTHGTGRSSLSHYVEEVRAAEILMGPFMVLLMGISQGCAIGQIGGPNDQLAVIGKGIQADFGYGRQVGGKVFDRPEYRGFSNHRR